MSIPPFHLLLILRTIPPVTGFYTSPRVFFLSALLQSQTSRTYGDGGGRLRIILLKNNTIVATIHIKKYFQYQILYETWI